MKIEPPTDTTDEPPITNAQLHNMTHKIGALVIILGAPLWPHREMLSDSGKLLHDVILRDAKPYSLLIAAENWPKAYAMLAMWPANAFMDETLINHHDSATRLANRRMLHVYKHYADAARINWDLFQGGKS